MPVSSVVGLVFEAWSDLDRVLDGLSVDDAVGQVDSGSSFAWTLGHIGEIASVRSRRLGQPERGRLPGRAARLLVAREGSLTTREPTRYVVRDDNRPQHYQHRKATAQHTGNT